MIDMNNDAWENLILTLARIASSLERLERMYGRKEK